MISILRTISAISFTILIVTFLLVILNKNSKSANSIKNPKGLRIHRLQRWIDSSNLNMSYSQFLLYSAGIGVITYFPIYIFSKTILISLIISFSFTFIPSYIVSKRRAEKFKELMYAWPDSLRDISSYISSGQSLTKSLSHIALDRKNALSPYMQRFTSLEKTLGFSGALETIRKEMSDATSDRIIEILILANDRGGRIIKDIINDLTTSTMQDIALAESIQSESLEMKINSRAVVILPWLVLFMLTLTEGAFRDFYQSSSGSLVIAIGSAMTLIGVAILSKLTQVQLEPRVFKKLEGYIK